jgi:adenosylhomocysteine nucleosidase
MGRDSITTSPPRDGDVVAAPAFLVGFGAEARIARRAGWPVGVGGGTAAGAVRAARALIAAGATGLISFGLAGGLAPDLPAGAVIVPNRVITLGGAVWRADPALSARFGGASDAVCLAVDEPATTADGKRRLFEQTGASLVDMESAAAAAAAEAACLPFAVVRAICDPAWRDLPPAALVALDASGGIAVGRLLRSILANPGQMGALIALGRESGLARAALMRRIAAIGA